MPMDASCHANSLPIPRAAPVTTATPPPYLGKSETSNGRISPLCGEPQSGPANMASFQVPERLCQVASRASDTQCFETITVCMCACPV